MASPQNANEPQPREPPSSVARTEMLLLAASEHSWVIWGLSPAMSQHVPTAWGVTLS